MTFLRYTHTRSRSRSRERSPIHIVRPLVRRASKRNLSDDSDDGYDDYPYPPNHKPVKPSRALTIRNQPSQLERYNIWTDRRTTPSDERREEDRQASLHIHRHRSREIDDEDAEERAFRLKIRAKFAHRSPSHTRSPSPPRHAHVWPSVVFRRRERRVDEDFEAGAQARSPPRRRVSFWDEQKEDGSKEERMDEEEENWMRFRRVKRTRTEEWRPLNGWRRG